MRKTWNSFYLWITWIISIFSLGFENMIKYYYIFSSAFHIWPTKSKTKNKIGDIWRRNGDKPERCIIVKNMDFDIIQTVLKLIIHILNKRAIWSTISSLEKYYHKLYTVIIVLTKWYDICESQHNLASGKYPCLILLLKVIKYALGGGKNCNSWKNYLHIDFLDLVQLSYIFKKFYLFLLNSKKMFILPNLNNKFSYAYTSLHTQSWCIIDFQELHQKLKYSMALSCGISCLINSSLKEKNSTVPLFHHF